MNIRKMNEEDKIQLRKIHDEFYSNEFPFSHFDNFLSAFVIEDNDKIVVGGGIRPIVESIILTDKNFKSREKREALYNMLQCQLFAASRLKYEHLHAFVQDESWQHCLEKIGFHSPKGNCLILEV